MPNYLAKLNQESKFSDFTLEKLNVLNEKNEPVNFNTYKGKILIIDIWFTACAPCIRQFPDLQRVQDEFKKDSSVCVIALNIPLEQENDRDRAKMLTTKYNFEKLYFTTSSEVDKLSLKSFPVTLVFNKKMECIYAGNLLLNPLVYLDNIYSIIKKTPN